jgi:hypothetical protein
LLVVLEFVAMSTLITVCILAITTAFAVLYQLGSPCDGFSDGVKWLPGLVLVMAIIPLGLLRTKWVDSSDKQVMRAAFCLTLIMPVCLWQIGYTLLVHISYFGSGPLG